MESSGAGEPPSAGRRFEGFFRELFEPPSNSHSGRVLWVPVGLTLLFSLLMLPYALNVIGELAPERQEWTTGVGASYVTSYLIFVALGESRVWVVRMLMCALLLGLGAILVALAGLENAWMLIFALCVISAFTRAKLASSVVVIVVASLAVAAVVTGTFDEVLSDLVLLASVGIAMILFMRLVDANAELRRARDRIAAFAVVEERERFARDLHDILGHSLTTITVKAGLLRRMLENSGQEAEAKEAWEVERIARQSLADVRETASGYRAVTLAGELAVAGTVLRSAGITARLPQAVDEVAPEARQVFGYVVREAVTNTVRHSGAREFGVRLGRDWVVVEDDGPGKGAVHKGNGLRGLEERMAAKGGALHVGRRPGGGFFVRAELVPNSAGGGDDGSTE